MQTINKIGTRVLSSRKQNKLLIFFLITFLTANLFAQSKGSISGIVTDKSINDAMIGANVLVEGTATGASTDLDGFYSIKNLDPGIYTLRFSFISYQSVVVNNVKVEAGKDTKVNVGLLPATTEIAEVVVTAEALQSTEGAVLSIQKNSLNIVDGLSAELISKNNSSDGTDILKRMTGVTISDGKYAYVRGVGDRYNNTLLNGASLPSTDPEKKSFSYDLFPASLIENVLTSKTFTPDKPADFSGGLVEINTVEFPNKFILDVSASTSYNSETNLKSFQTYAGGKNDWLGYDDGTRDLPSLVTDDKVGRGNYNSDELKQIGLGFGNSWATNSTTAPMNGSFKINIGDRFDLSDNDIIGYIASINYSNGTDTKEVERSNYTFEGPRYVYAGTNYTESVSLGALLNISYKFAQSHKISFKNIFNQNADDETTFFEGDYYSGRDHRQVTSLRYVSRSLLSSQLIGEHHLSFLSGLDIDWNANYAVSDRNEPDGRRYIYSKDLDELSNPYRLLLDQSLTTRFYGKLDDKNLGFGTNFTLRLSEDPFMPRFKFGFHTDNKDRDFDARTFGFRNIPGGNFAAEDSTLQLSIDRVFQSENINNRFIEVIEITKPSDSYISEQNITAGYVMMDFDLFSTVKVITGVRYEHSVQELNSNSQTGEEVKIKHEYKDWLPSVNLTLPFNDIINLRLAYSKTLARPEFRELAPFSYFDFLSNELVVGNTELQRSLVTNYDFRFEVFPSPKELYALSVFYKKFKNPIEEILIASSAFEPIRSYENANSAISYGVEFELRKNMNFIGQSFENFSVVGNLSFINSEIELENRGFQESKRPLQGQADFILNTGIYYDDFNSGLSASLIYNKVGEKILKVGFAGLGDVVEKPRDQIDFTISKNLFSNLNLKFSVKDLLAQDRIAIQKTANDGDKTAELTKYGRTISLGLGFKF